MAASQVGWIKSAVRFDKHTQALRAYPPTRDIKRFVTAAASGMVALAAIAAVKSIRVR